MPSKPILNLFEGYKEMAKEVKEKGAREVLEDLQRYYPDLYYELEKEFEYRQRVKKLGILLAGPSRSY